MRMRLAGATTILVLAIGSVALGAECCKYTEHRSVFQADANCGDNISVSANTAQGRDTTIMIKPVQSNGMSFGGGDVTIPEKDLHAVIDALQKIEAGLKKN